MKTLICTNCLKTVSVPDAAPGSDVNCPECGKSFAVPAAYTPTVAAEPVPVAPPPVAPPPAAVVPPVAPPPKPVVPPAPAGYVPPAPPAPPAPPHAPSAGYTRARSIAVNPRGVAWLPAVCLSLVLFMSFVCAWVESAPAGHPVHAQGLWKASFGGLSRNLQLEQNLPKDLSVGWIDLLKPEFQNWELLLPALLALMLATVAAWADRRFETLDAKRLPPPLKWTASLWSSRKLIIGALTAFALAFVTIQAASGFGMEKAIKKSVAERFKDERKAAGASESAQAGVDFKEEELVRRYEIRYTTWAYLSFLLLTITVLAVVVRWGLERRGNKPPPRLVFEY